MTVPFWLQTLCVVLLLKLKGQHTTTVLTRHENLAIIKENTSVSLNEFWNSNGSFNDPNNEKHVLPLYSILPDGNFRSYILDNWSHDPPAEIALLVLNNISDMMFWLLFNTNGAAMEIESWMTKSRLIGAFPNILNYVSVETSWNVNNYQFVLYSDHYFNASWFAVGNFSSENQNYPQFLIPLNVSKPFHLPLGHLNSTTRRLLKSVTFGPGSEFQLDVSNNGSSVYVSGIFCDGVSLAVTTGNTVTRNNYNMEYSDKPCSDNTRVSYRDENSYIVTFQTGVHTTIETIYVSCIWITMADYYKNVDFSVFGPSELETEFIRGPVLVFRGYWYQDVQSSTSTEAPSTTSQSSSEQTSSLINMITDTSTGNIPTFSTTEPTIGNILPVSTADTTTEDIPTISTADTNLGNILVVSTADTITGDMPTISTAGTTTGDISGISTADTTTGDIPTISTAGTTTGDMPAVSTADTTTGDIPTISTAGLTGSEDFSVTSLSHTTTGGSSFTSVVRDTSADNFSTTSKTNMVQYNKTEQGLNSSTISSTLIQMSSGCVCTCSNGNSHILTISDLDEQIEKIKKELSLNKKKLSSYSRTLISIPDHRLSASCMGISAGVILGVIFAIIVILDLSTFRNNVNSMLRRTIHIGKWKP